MANFSRPLVHSAEQFKAEVVRPREEGTCWIELKFGPECQLAVFFENSVSAELIHDLAERINAAAINSTTPSDE